jgi:hypothetical protein
MFLDQAVGYILMAPPSLNASATKIDRCSKSGTLLAALLSMLLRFEGLLLLIVTSTRGLSIAVTNALL